MRVDFRLYETKNLLIDKIMTKIKLFRDDLWLYETKMTNEEKSGNKLNIHEGLNTQIFCKEK